MTEDAEPIGFQILRSIRRITRKTSEHSRSLARSGGINIPQTLCLKAVSEFSRDTEITVALISEVVQLSPPTVSRILDRLEKNGYLVRERSSSDRRKLCVSLTAAGWKRIEHLPEPLHQRFLHRLEELEPAERLGLLKALERIVELMDAKGVDASPMLIPELEVDAPIPEPEPFPESEPEASSPRPTADRPAADRPAADRPAADRATADRAANKISSRNDDPGQGDLHELEPLS
jgi:DNA-binding MarR family transcriptional regulator